MIRIFEVWINILSCCSIWLFFSNRSFFSDTFDSSLLISTQVIHFFLNPVMHANQSYSSFKAIKSYHRSLELIPTPIPVHAVHSVSTCLPFLAPKPSQTLRIYEREKKGKYSIGIREMNLIFWKKIPDRRGIPFFWYNSDIILPRSFVPSKSIQRDDSLFFSLFLSPFIIIIIIISSFGEKIFLSSVFPFLLVGKRDSR